MGFYYLNFQIIFILKFKSFYFIAFIGGLTIAFENDFKT
ncbi:putative membrane protein [Acinetobacter sp. 1264765]|nr:putative membrane protein [Acinetobacter sp. 1264765]